MIPDVKKSAIKISDMFADSRMDNDDIDRIALMAGARVAGARTEAAL